MIIRNARTIRYCRTLPHGNLPRDHKDLYSGQNAIGSDAPDHNEFPPRKLLVSGWEQIFLPLSWMDLTMDFHQVSWISIKFHGFPSSFMVFPSISSFRFCLVTTKAVKSREFCSQKSAAGPSAHATLRASCLFRVPIRCTISSCLVADGPMDDEQNWGP